MEDRRLGRAAKAVRRRLQLRQSDVGARAGVSQALVSRFERGDIERIQVRTIRAILTALDADLVVTLRWRGGDLDRLLDEAHAALCGVVAGMVERDGWLVRPEVTFAVAREHGSIDLLAWHAETRTLLVVEVKSELTSVEETLRRHDAKARLAAEIARERLGWDPRSVARMLAFPSTATARRRVSRHDGILSRAYPLRGPAARAWLRSPGGASASLIFVSPTLGVRTSNRPIRPQRVRVPPDRSSRT